VWGHSELVVAVAVLGTVTAISVWTLAPAYQRQPAVAVGYSLIDIGFTVTALLLAAQEGQRSNARLAGLIAASSLASHFLTRDVGIADAPLFLAGSLTQVLGGMLILRYPSPRFDPWSRRWVQVNLPLAALFGLALLLTSRPGWVDAAPTDWWPAVWPDRSLNQQVAFARSVWRVLVVVSFMFLLVRRWLRLPRLERRTLSPILYAAVFGATVIGADLLQWWLPPAATVDLIIVRSYTGAVIALAFVASALQMTLARASVTGLAAALAAHGPPTTVRDALRRTLDDDSLEVFYWLPETSSFVDDVGAPRSDEVGDARMTLTVSDSEGSPLALIEADRSLTRHRDLIDSALAISRLALENARLQAGLRAQLAEISDARARLLSSGFAQRRQLERDLHDGAQQRLLALGMRLATLESVMADDRSRTAVHAAKADLQAAMAELRQLARGIYPVILAQRGLAPALESVAERLPLLVELDVPDERWPSDVEGVAYLVACEGLTNAVKHSGAQHARVAVAERGRDLQLTVSDDGRGWVPPARPALPELADRVEALGGRLVVTSGDGGTTVAATIPLPHLPTTPGRAS
jgi:signal transduction histidine kinase